MSRATWHSPETRMGKRRATRPTPQGWRGMRRATDHIPVWGQEGTIQDTPPALTGLSQQQQHHEGQRRKVTPRHGHCGDRGHTGPGVASGPQPRSPGVTSAFPVPFPSPVSPRPCPQRGQMAAQ